MEKSQKRENVFIPESCDGAQILHDKDFFVVDFWTQFPSRDVEPYIEPFIRIKMNPKVYRDVIKAMKKNLKKYDDKFKK